MNLNSYELRQRDLAPKDEVQLHRLLSRQQRSQEVADELQVPPKCRARLEACTCECQGTCLHDGPKETSNSCLSHADRVSWWGGRCKPLEWILKWSEMSLRLPTSKPVGQGNEFCPKLREPAEAANGFSLFILDTSWTVPATVCSCVTCIRTTGPSTKQIRNTPNQDSVARRVPAIKFCHAARAHCLCQYPRRALLACHSVPWSQLCVPHHLGAAGPHVRRGCLATMTAKIEQHK